MQEGSKKTTYVCFECRKTRRLCENFTRQSRDAVVTCPQCQEAMSSIGHRLRVPRKGDQMAWDEFWKQYNSPGHGMTGDAEIDEENLHYRRCKARNRAPPEDGVSTGCDKCDKVWQRMSKEEKQKAPTEYQRQRWRELYMRSQHSKRKR